MTVARGAASLLVAALGAVPAAGQRLAPVVHAALVEHRVDAGAGVEVSSGPLLGMGLEGRFGDRFRAGLEVGAAALSSEGQADDRDLAQLRLAAGFQATPWALLEAGYFMRTYTTPLARQRWSGVFAGATARVPFAARHLVALGVVSLLPSVSASELDSPGPSLAAAAGVEWRVSRVAVGLTYGVERYDFPAQAGVLRSERLTSLALRIAWR
jgi:hypothetical protein